MTPDNNPHQIQQTQSRLLAQYALFLDGSHYRLTASQLSMMIRDAFAAGYTDRALRDRELASTTG